MIVLDAGVLIAYGDSRDTHHAAAVDFLTEHCDHEFAISPLTLAEVLVRPALADRVGEALSVFMDLDLVVNDIREVDAVVLAKTRASTTLKMPDALVVHVAVRDSAHIATTDAVLASKARELGIHTYLVTA